MDDERLIQETKDYRLKTPQQVRATAYFVRGKHKTKEEVRGLEIRDG